MGDPGIAGRIRRELLEEFNLHTIVRLPKGVFEPYSDIQTNLLFFDRSQLTKEVWFVEHEVPVERRTLQNPGYTQSTPLRFEELEPLIGWWKKRNPTQNAWVVSVSDIISASYSFDFRNPNHRPEIASNVHEIIERFRPSASRVDAMLQQLDRAAKESKSLEPRTWARVPLKKFLSPAREEADVDNEKLYKQVTVKLYGKGAVLRQELRGSEIRTRPQFHVRAGHLIMSRIDARNGAFAVVPEELDGAIVTQDFPVFRVDSAVIDPDFLALLLRSRTFIEACKRASRGTTNRKRLKTDVLLEELIPLPAKPLQNEVVNLARSLNGLAIEVDMFASDASNAVPMLANFLFG